MKKRLRMLRPGGAQGCAQHVAQAQARRVFVVLRLHVLGRSREASDSAGATACAVKPAKKHLLPLPDSLDRPFFYLSAVVFISCSCPASHVAAACNSSNCPTLNGLSHPACCPGTCCAGRVFAVSAGLLSSCFAKQRNRSISKASGSGKLVQ